MEVAVTGKTQQDIDAVIASCQQHQLPWRDAREMLARKERYTTLVSSFPQHYLRGSDSPYLPKSIGRYNLRFMYANGKAGWNFQPWNRVYDSILCFGPYQAEHLEYCQDTLKIQMGYPRFDRFFNQPLDRPARLAELKLDPNCQTVVWLPTWSTLSSIELFAAAVARLQARYNVIVKPHPITITDEPARMRELERFGCVISEHIDNVELFQLADFLLCDYGGSAFGGIYTDRNVLLLDLPNAGADPLTGNDSSDIVLRKHLPHLIAQQSNRLEELLEDDSLWEAQRPIRKTLSQSYFAPFYGYAGQVAAVAIANSARSLAGRG
ncbi:CDP-glycerol glycerophosphotransferase family protein [Ectopseudomonas toyotomiensis]|uniref:CDP-glycerol glycerophosphotransferase family protein n=1 Tax=Ectopseudomonas toyotomiensis TaxID=554344 RepID=A0AA42IKH0_9GAMM|nr:CDP-glycerol glycerophosphotransferase family protein [Pseudomonas toyotomiensis]MBG0842089.1 CDP-glycerol glycerophosphotransferase family protein [Pseudomonas toyotomiensis]MDH0701125.1 CDP-glycerol glycerophosphotransferase family protein [Pseudomonas toyotomiensis]